MHTSKSSVLTPIEKVQARILGEQIIDLVTQHNPLIAGFALFAVVRALPPVRDAFRVATMGFQAALKAGPHDSRH